MEIPSASHPRNSNCSATSSRIKGKLSAIGACCRQSGVLTTGKKQSICVCSSINCEKKSSPIRGSRATFTPNRGSATVSSLALKKSTRLAQQSKSHSITSSGVLNPNQDSVPEHSRVAHRESQVGAPPNAVSPARAHLLPSSPARGQRAALENPRLPVKCADRGPIPTLSPGPPECAPPGSPFAAPEHSQTPDRAAPYSSAPDSTHLMPSDRIPP